MPWPKRPRNLRGRNLSVAWDPNGIPYDMNFTDLKLNLRSGGAIELTKTCLETRNIAHAKWWSKVDIVEDSRSFMKLTHFSYVNPSGINYIIRSTEGKQYPQWPGWLTHDNYEWISHITFEYTYAGNRWHDPIIPYFEMWGYHYDIIDGEAKVNIKLPDEKPVGEMSFGVPQGDWQIYCPPPEEHINQMYYERKLTLYYNFKFYKRCFAAVVTGPDSFWFWISRAEGNPPMLCPPFFVHEQNIP